MARDVGKPRRAMPKRQSYLDSVLREQRKKQKAFGKASPAPRKK